MKRGTKRGNSTLDTLTDGINTRSVNKRFKLKALSTSHQSTTVQSEDSFIYVDNNDMSEQNIAYYKTLVTKLERQVPTLSADMKERQKQVTDLITQMSFVTSWLENSVTPGSALLLSRISPTSAQLSQLLIVLSKNLSWQLFMSTVSVV